MLFETGDLGGEHAIGEIINVDSDYLGVHEYGIRIAGGGVLGC